MLDKVEVRTIFYNFNIEKDSQQDLSWLLIVIPIGFLIISFLLKLHKLLSLSLQRIDKTRKNFHQLLKTRSNLNHLEQLSLEMRYDLLDHLKLDNFKKLLSFSWWKKDFLPFIKVLYFNSKKQEWLFVAIN